MEELVIHVDEEDNVLGYIPKLKAHELGLLHRAISVLIFNSKGEWLLQRRAIDKYHSGGLWTNTCCSHPLPEESVEDAANRRLQEEMGMKCRLEKVFSFTYKAHLDNQLIEHEIDHVFIGTTDDIPKININEASDWCYVDIETLQYDMDKYPENFTKWFKLLLPKALFSLSLEGQQS